jgi:cytoskeleton protein RodZ
MTSIGETLRGERERRNLNLDQVSQELKISARFLQALEEEKFDRLPAGVFAKSFARQYAHLLGLDEDEIANEVQRALAPPPAVLQSSAGEPDKPKPEPMAEFYVPKLEAWQRVRDPQRFSWSSPLSALALVVVVMLGCSLVYGWWVRSRHPATAAFVSAPASQHAAPAPAKTEPPPEPAAAASPVAPPPEQISASSGPPASPPAAQPPAIAAPAGVAVGAAGPVKVAVTAAEAVWVLARADGKFSFSGTLEANETRTVEAENTVLLRLGNAGGVTITLNGKSIGEVGPKGQVRTVQLTSGGFQIVAPKPSAPADDPL